MIVIRIIFLFCVFFFPALSRPSSGGLIDALTTGGVARTMRMCHHLHHTHLSWIVTSPYVFLSHMQWPAFSATAWLWKWSHWEITFFLMKKEPSPERCAVVMDDGWRRSYYPIKVSATGGQVCHLGPRFHPSFLWALLMILLSLFRRRVMNVKQSKGILSPRWRRIDFLQSDDGMSGWLFARFLKRTEMRKW
jgi:hypothetical protein